MSIFEFLKFMFVSESLNSIRFEHDLASLSSLDSDLSNPSMAFGSFKFAVNGQISSRLIKKSVEVIARSLKKYFFWCPTRILNIIFGFQFLSYLKVPANWRLTISMNWEMRISVSIRIGPGISGSNTLVWSGRVDTNRFFAGADPGVPGTFINVLTGAIFHFPASFAIAFRNTVVIVAKSVDTAVVVLKLENLI